MVFSSSIFIFGFLPILLLFYFLSPKKLKNYILLLFSLIFYAFGGIKYLFINILFFNLIYFNFILFNGITSVSLA